MEKTKRAFINFSKKILFAEGLLSCEEEKSKILNIPAKNVIKKKIKVINLNKFTKHEIAKTSMTKFTLGGALILQTKHMQK